MSFGDFRVSWLLVVLLAVVVEGSVVADSVSAWTSDLAGDTLTVSAASGEVNNFQIADSGASYLVTDYSGVQFSGQLPDGCSLLLPNRLECPVVAVGELVLDAGDGNDQVSDYSSVLAVHLSGGDGQDTLSGGSGINTLSGGLGEDDLFGGVSDDQLDGGEDEDSLWGSGGNDTLLGGDSADTLTGGDGNDSIEGEVGDDVLFGGDGNDSLLGGDGTDSLDGSLGDDVLQGESGKDSLTGGDGADLLNGGDDGDAIAGGSGNDTLDGGLGSDLLQGGLDTDLLSGGSGGDMLDGSAGNDQLSGGSGDDLLIGGTGADSMEGGDGDHDTVSYASRSESLQLSLDGQANDGASQEHDFLATDNETLMAGQGDDTITGSANTDTVYAGSGADTVAGLAGNDRLEGQGGDDTLTGGEGSDTLLGGDGFDTASYRDRARGVQVTLDDKADDGSESEGDLVVVESVLGGSGPDKLYGSVQAGEVLDGGDGDDFISLVDEGTDSPPDLAVCGPGADIAVGDSQDRYEPDCEAFFTGFLPERPDPPPLTYQQSRAKLSFSSLQRIFALSGRRFVFKLRCGGHTEEACVFTVRLKLIVGLGRHPHCHNERCTRLVGVRRRTALPGRTVTFPFALPKGFVRALSKKPYSLRAKAYVTVKDRDGHRLERAMRIKLLNRDRYRSTGKASLRDG